MQIKLAKRAEIDLKSALRYIAVELDNETASRNLDREARKLFAMVADLPELYSLVYDDDLLFQKGVRKMPIKKYLAFYVIYEEIQTVYILRILHSSCNWLSIMQNEAVKL